MNLYYYRTHQDERIIIRILIDLWHKPILLIEPIRIRPNLWKNISFCKLKSLKRDKSKVKIIIRSTTQQNHQNPIKFDTHTNVKIHATMEGV